MLWCVSFPGNSLSDDISCLAADRMLVFAAAGTVISAFARNKEVGAGKESFSFIILIIPFFYVTHFITKKEQAKQIYE